MRSVLSKPSLFNKVIYQLSELFCHDNIDDDGVWFYMASYKLESNYLMYPLMMWTL